MEIMLLHADRCAVSAWRRRIQKPTIKPGPQAAMCQVAKKRSVVLVPAVTKAAISAEGSLPAPAVSRRLYCQAVSDPELGQREPSGGFGR